MENIRQLINETLSSIGVEYSFVNQEELDDTKYFIYQVEDLNNKSFIVSFTQENNTKESVIQNLVYGMAKDGYKKGREDEMDFIINQIKNQRQEELFSAFEMS